MKMVAPDRTGVKADIAGMRPKIDRTLMRSFAVVAQAFQPASGTQAGKLPMWIIQQTDASFGCILASVMLCTT